MEQKNHNTTRVSELKNLSQEGHKTSAPAKKEDQNSKQKKPTSPLKQKKLHSLKDLQQLRGQAKALFRQNKNQVKKDFSSKKESQPHSNKKLSFLKKKQTAELEKELEEMKKSYRYLQAEFANYKKTSLRERSQAVQFAATSFIQDFFKNVFNDFNRAMEKKWRPQDFESFKKGVEILHAQMIKSLQKHGVEEINPKGEVFDPHWHEVVSTQHEDQKEEGLVLQVHRKGYKLHDRLIQPAQVVVNAK